MESMMSKYFRARMGVVCIDFIQPCLYALFKFISKLGHHLASFATSG